MSFDNLCKLLSEKHPVAFASWVLAPLAATIQPQTLLQQVVGKVNQLERMLSIYKVL